MISRLNITCGKFSRLVVTLIMLPLSSVIADIPVPSWWQQEPESPFFPSSLPGNTTEPSRMIAVNHGQVCNLLAAAIKHVEANDGEPDVLIPQTGSRREKMLKLLAHIQVKSNIPYHQVVDHQQFKLYLAPLYNRLAEIGYFRKSGGLTLFPWTLSGLSATPDSIVNLGMVKHHFQFDLATDSDDDGTPDWVEFKLYHKILNPRRPPGWSAADIVFDREALGSDETEISNAIATALAVNRSSLPLHQRLNDRADARVNNYFTKCYDFLRKGTFGPSGQDVRHLFEGFGYVPSNDPTEDSERWNTLIDRWVDSQGAAPISEYFDPKHFLYHSRGVEYILSRSPAPSVPSGHDGKFQLGFAIGNKWVATAMLNKDATKVDLAVGLRDALTVLKDLPDWRNPNPNLDLESAVRSLDISCTGGPLPEPIYVHMSPAASVEKLVHAYQKVAPFRLAGPTPIGIINPSAPPPPKAVKDYLDHFAFFVAPVLPDDEKIADLSDHLRPNDLGSQRPKTLWYRSGNNMFHAQRPNDRMTFDWLVSQGWHAEEYWWHLFYPAQSAAVMTHHAIHSPDQLRQRMSLALSEIIVVSRKDPDLGSGEGNMMTLPLAHFYQMLHSNALGNYRDLLELVTLHPVMGIYLDNMGSKGNGLTAPNQNYARELMQLFTCGKMQFNEADGTETLYEMYNQADVAAAAQLLSGWSACQQDIATKPDRLQQSNFLNTWHPRWYDEKNDSKRQNWEWIEGLTGDPHHIIAYAYHMRPLYASPMAPVENWHSGAFTAGGLLPFRQGTTAGGTRADMRHVLNVLCGIGSSTDEAIKAVGMNTAMHISRQLIQFLATSNPSPAFVKKVAEVFYEQRASGDQLKLVAAEILKYQPNTNEQDEYAKWGQVREPYVRWVHAARVLQLGMTAAHGPDLQFGLRKPLIWGLTTMGANEFDTTRFDRLTQFPLNAPSVFNFFSPTHQITVGTAKLFAPVMQISHEGQLQLFIDELAGHCGANNTGARPMLWISHPRLSNSSQGQIAGDSQRRWSLTDFKETTLTRRPWDPQKVVDWLDDNLCGRQMSSLLRTHLLSLNNANMDNDAIQDFGVGAPKVFNGVIYAVLATLMSSGFSTTGLNN